MLKPLPGNTHFGRSIRKQVHLNRSYTLLFSLIFSQKAARRLALANSTKLAAPAAQTRQTDTCTYTQREHVTVSVLLHNLRLSVSHTHPDLFHPMPGLHAQRRIGSEQVVRFCVSCVCGRRASNRSTEHGTREGGERGEAAHGRGANEVRAGGGTGGAGL